MVFSINRRAFLQTALSGAAQALFGRYDTILKVLSSNGASSLIAAATNRFDPVHLKDYYHLFEFSRWLTTDEATGTYTFDTSCFLPNDEKHTLADLPSFSQKTLRSIYGDVLNSFEDEIKRLSFALRYKDDIGPIVQFMQSNAEKIAELTDTPPEWVKIHLGATAKTFGTHEQVRDILEKTLTNYGDLLSEIRHHLSPESLNILGRTPFLSLPEAGFDIPYLFDTNQLRGVAESLAFEDHGHFLDIMDAAPEWKQFLTALGKTDSAKSRLAHRCLKWEPSYFNRELMQQAGITEEHLSEGLRASLHEEMEREGWKFEISDHSYKHMLHKAGIHESQMEESFLHLENMTDNGTLIVNRLTPADERYAPQHFEIIMTPTADDPHLGGEMDDVTDILSSAIDGFSHTLERTAPYRAEITVEDFHPADFLNNLASRTKFVSRHGGGFTAQLRRIREKTTDFAGLMEMAKKLRPVLGL